MSTKGKYYRSKFRSNTIKIESNQSNEESVINIVNLPPEIYFSTASQFPMLSFNGNAKRKSTSITLDTKHSSSSNVCSQRLSVSNNHNDSIMSKSFRQDFKDNKKELMEKYPGLNIELLFKEQYKSAQVARFCNPTTHDLAVFCKFPTHFFKIAPKHLSNFSN